jgi:arginine:ornithine antiporter/lysine permease
VTEENNAGKLGLMGLVGVVAGSMIGGAIFALPSKMAQGAGAGSVILAWIITGIGMFFLANTFSTLAQKRPDLNSGIYDYATEGFGRFAGFEVAWGYWLSAAFGNVAFSVLILKALTYFVPALGTSGLWPKVLVCSLLIWSMHFLVLRGVSSAALLNSIATIAKLVPVAVVIIACFIVFELDTFKIDFWAGKEDLGGIGAQVKSTMLVTLWAFIGIEGAAVISGRARSPELVGKATFIGLILCLSLYLCISVLPFGLMHEPEMAALKDPSVAGVFAKIVGSWGAAFVNFGVLISLLGCWLSWTILVAEVPYQAAKEGVFPRVLAGQNSKGAPAPSLWMTSCVMQVILLLAMLSSDAFDFLINITGVMVLPSYLVSAVFLWQISRGGDNGLRLAFLTGVMATLFALWLLYAAGPAYLMMSTVLFSSGIIVYWMSQGDTSAKPFVGREKLFALGLLMLAITAIVLFAMGILKFS